MINLKIKRLKVSQVRDLVNDLVGEIDLKPGQTPSRKGVIALTQNIEARYHLIQLLKVTELILESYNESKNALLKQYISYEEKSIDPSHPKWNEFYSKLLVLLNIELDVKLPTIPIEKFSDAISDDSTYIHFYEHIIDQKPWEASLSLTELQKKMKAAIMPEPEPIPQIGEEKPLRESQESITPSGEVGN